MHQRGLLGKKVVSKSWGGVYMPQEREVYMPHSPSPVSLHTIWRGIVRTEDYQWKLFRSEILSSDDASSVTGRYTGCRIVEEVQRNRGPVKSVSAHVSLLTRLTLFQRTHDQSRIVKTTRVVRKLLPLVRVFINLCVEGGTIASISPFFSMIRSKKACHRR